MEKTDSSKEFNWKTTQEKIINKTISKHGDRDTAIVNMDAQISSLKISLDTVRDMWFEADKFLLGINKELLNIQKKHEDDPNPINYLNAMLEVEKKINDRCNEIAEFYEDN